MAVATKERTQNLSAALREVAEKDRGRPKGVDKRFTAMKTTKAPEDGGTAGATSSGVSEPTSEELAQINEFTKTPKQAHEVAVFSTLSCNDLLDRDDERFDTDTVKEFAALPQPYSPIGKSYMVGHDYTKLPVGRIFDAGITSAEGGTFLTNKVYVPNTEQYKSFLENQDFGVYWAVSVGVMLKESLCGLSFCGAQMFRYGWCANGHDKGYYYTEDAETDSWGYPMPVDSRTAGAEKTTGLMKGAQDFYELSQVFLGAQFFAALEKEPGFKGVMKAAGKSNVPILGLSREEAKSLPLPHLDDRAAKAVREYGAKWDADGTLRWTDPAGLVYTYSPDDSEVLCLGKEAESSDSADNEEDTNGTATAEPDEDALGEDDGESGSGSGGSDDSEGDDSGNGGSGESGEVGAGDGSDGGVASDDDSDSADAEEDDDDKEKAVSKAVLLKSLRGLKAPATILSAVEGAAGDSLDAALSPVLALVKSQGEQITSLTAKAALGDQYVSVAKGEAIEWYVRANQIEGKGVNTDAFQKLLDNCGENLDMIKSLTEMQKSLAQAKFPAATRRSSHPADPNATDGPGTTALQETEAKRSDKAVGRLHS